ncbi:eEF1A lysine and N-terminal methyltransferase-like [Hylaeus volcanicus]|uniref:eEF1A lysine and N-terminal methyltransferase-like n=1 Tax=Hylaeus volcanicus TaxID=313075 RepID=UPI0023B798C6|nr:eEF1A lysine and N-terminal methyltransferase-like [Hylaeus volcanicus]
MDLIASFERRWMQPSYYWGSLWTDNYLLERKNNDWSKLVTILNVFLFQKERQSNEYAILVFPENWNKIWCSISNNFPVETRHLIKAIPLKVPFDKYTFESELLRHVSIRDTIGFVCLLGVFDCFSFREFSVASAFFSCLFVHSHLKKDANVSFVDHLPQQSLKYLIRWLLYSIHDKTACHSHIYHLRISDFSESLTQPVDVPWLFLLSVERKNEMCAKTTTSSASISCSVTSAFFPPEMSWDNVYTLPRMMLSLLKYRTQKMVIDKLVPGSFTYYYCNGSDSSTVEYTIIVYDTHVECPKTRECGLFIRENQATDWLFKTSEGLEKIGEQCSTSRLLVVIVRRTTNTSSQDNLQKEFETMKEKIGSKLAMLTPFPRVDQAQICFLTVNDPEESLGSVVDECDSNYAGKILVYDVPNMDSVEFPQKRLMVFSCNPRVIQSEAQLDKEKNVCGTLSCSEYYGGIILSLSFLNKTIFSQKDAVTCRILGLGGGVLALCLAQVFQFIGTPLLLTVVELDPQVVRMAQKWFMYEEIIRRKFCCCTIQTVIKDALQDIQELPEETQNLVILDINGDSNTKAMLCPSPEFVQTKFLLKIHTVLKSGGLFILNLATRCENTKKNVYSSLQSIFCDCCVIKTKHEINEVVICRKQNKENSLSPFSKSMLQSRLNCHIASLVAAFNGNPEEDLVKGISNNQWNEQLFVINKMC